MFDKICITNSISYANMWSLPGPKAASSYAALQDMKSSWNSVREAQPD